MQLFGTKGQKFLPCPGTKGQRDKLKILPRDRTGGESQNSGWDGTGRDGTAKSETGQPKSRTGCRTKPDIAEGPSKTENNVLKQERIF